MTFTSDSTCTPTTPTGSLFERTPTLTRESAKCAWQASCIWVWVKTLTSNFRQYQPLGFISCKVDWLKTPTAAEIKTNSGCGVATVSLIPGPKPSTCTEAAIFLKFVG